MKRIVDHDDKIELPKCMYHIKNPIDLTEEDEICLKINEKVLKFIKVYINCISQKLTYKP